MIDTGLKNKVVLVTGGNNPFGIGAAIAKAFASQGSRIFIHYFRQNIGFAENSEDDMNAKESGLPFYFEQQRKTADEVVANIRKNGGDAECWEGDLREPADVAMLFEKVEEAFGKVDILVNNAAVCISDTFLPSSMLGNGACVWSGGPKVSTLDNESHNCNFAANTRAPAILMTNFARRIIERQTYWGRIINISADCASGCPKQISYRASKYALESYSRSAAAELGPSGITVNIVSPGPVQSGYISPEREKAVEDIPLRRVGRPEDIANAVVFFASEQACWITGQLLTVHGGHRMALGLM